MNLKKFTKAELISKLKRTESKTDSNKSSNISIFNQAKIYFLQIIDLVLVFKSILIKLTLFTILIKYFRKIGIMRIIFRIINYIFFATFGIIISDIYGLKEIIAQIEYYWMEYVNFIHESKIYKTLLKIFHVITDENGSEVIDDKSKIVENKSEIIEKKKSEIVKNKFEIPSSGTELKNEKIIHDKTSGGNEKENWFELNKYYLIGLSILSLGLIYICWDSIIEMFKNVTPGDDDSTTTEAPNFLDPQEEYNRYFKELESSQELYDLDVIKSQNKGTVIDYSDVENTKWGDSPTTPKASTSKLPETHGVILPFSKK